MDATAFADRSWCTFLVLGTRRTKLRRRLLDSRDRLELCEVLDPLPERILSVTIDLRREKVYAQYQH